MKRLAVRRPTDSNAGELFRPSNNMRAEQVRLVVCNTTAGAATFRLFIDETISDAFDEENALHWDTSVAAKTSVLVGWDDIMAIPTGGRIGVRTGTASALTFTAFFQ